ncbi:MAG: Zn-dependent alcohol dehydrogenase [Solirubrobacterales bacterium]
MPRAAIFNGPGQPLAVEEIDVGSPQQHEVKVQIVGAGVCHSDLSVTNGTMTTAAPSILGHEGAGIVEEVGPGVAALAPGDHVVVSWVPQCGECFYCDRGQPYLCEVGSPAMSAGSMLDGTYRAKLRGEPVPQYCAVGVFAETSVVAETSAVKVDPAIDLRLAALVGCGVLTGFGAAVNTAELRPGDNVAVIGCGGVGLNVIQGARVQGAERIIAIDLSEKKLALAKQLGATDLISAEGADVVEAVRELTVGRGVDAAFEVIGLKATAEQALAMTRNGGETILVGIAGADVSMEVPIFRGLVRYGKSLKGCFYGSSDVRRDVPRLVEAYLDGDLKLEPLASSFVPLERINDAFAALDAGEVTRSVVVFGDEASNGAENA